MDQYFDDNDNENLFKSKKSSYLKSYDFLNSQVAKMVMHGGEGMEVGHGHNKRDL